MLGQEARTKSCRFLLAPTINLHRSPLAGRNFECYSEDPAAVGQDRRGVRPGRAVRGCRRHRRSTSWATKPSSSGASMSSDIDERSLRELYLRPFELAVVEGGALAIMTGYNRLNGRFCTEDRRAPHHHPPRGVGVRGHRHDRLVRRRRHRRIRRRRPRPRDARPARAYGEALAAAVDERAGARRAQLDAIVERWLHVIDRLGAWDDDPPTEAVDRPAGAPRRGQAGGERLPACCSPTTACCRSIDGWRSPGGADRPSGRAGAHDGRRIGAARAPPPDLAARRHARSGSAIGWSSSRVVASTGRPRRSPGPRWRRPDGEPGVRVDLWNGPAIDGRAGGDASCSGRHARPPGRRARARGRRPTSRSGRDHRPHARPQRTPRPHARGARRATSLDSTACVVLEADEGLPREHGLFGMASIEREHPIDLVAGKPVELVVEQRSPRRVVPRTWSRSGCGRRRPATRSKPPSPPPRTPTWPWCSSARATSGRARATTARRWTCPVTRTSSCAGSPRRTRGRSCS